MTWDRVRFGFVLAVILLVGIGLTWYAAARAEQPTSHQVPQTLLFSVIGKAGEALLIAALLAVGVDRYVKRSLVQEVARDITPYAVAHFFPEQLKGEVQRLLQFCLIRNDFEVSIQFVPSTVKGYLIARTTSRYSVENLTNQTQTYEHTLSLMTSWYTDVPNLQNRILLAGSRGGLQSYEFPEAEIDKYIISSAAMTMEFRKEVRIPRRGSGPLVKCWNHYEVVCPDNGVDHVWFRVPTQGVSINISSPPEYEFQVFFPGKTDVESTPEGMPTQWQHSGIFLPGQFVRIRWRLRVSQQQGRILSPP